MGSLQQATSHSETLSKLRTEKLDAEQRRAAIEVEMTAEIDRLKTRFSFKVFAPFIPSASSGLRRYSVYLSIATRV